MTERDEPAAISRSAPEATDRDRIRRHEEMLAKLPKDVGALLFSLGVAGVMIPGPVPPGSVLVLAGMLFLWPNMLGRMGGWFHRRYPRAYVIAIGQLERFETDLERRYPGSMR